MSYYMRMFVYANKSNADDYNNWESSCSWNKHRSSVGMDQNTGWRIILNWLKAERGRGVKSEGDGRTEIWGKRLTALGIMGSESLGEMITQSLNRLTHGNSNHVSTWLLFMNALTLLGRHVYMHIYTTSQTHACTHLLWSCELWWSRFLCRHF